MSGIGDLSLGPMEDQLGLIAVRVGVWNHMEYSENMPAAGEHNAGAIRAGHGAIEAIDELIRDLHVLRGQLVGELRADETARAIRVDAMLAARQEATP